MLLTGRLAVGLTVAGTAFVAVAPGVAPAASTQRPSPGVPSSSVTVAGFTQVRYCVTDYAPGSRVSVTSPNGGDVAIRTSNVGAGCTVLPYQSVCDSSASRTIVAVGTGADGNPATSSATVANLAGAPSCSAAPRPHDAAKGSGISGLALGVLGGVAGLAVLAALALFVVRRRRTAD